MRIMHMSRAAETLRWFLIPVMTEQKKMGHQVCVCTGDSPDAEELRRAGFEVFTHGMKRILNPFAIIKTIFQMRRIVIEQRIDVTISHNSFCVSRIASWLAKTPHIIYFCHGFSCAPAQGAVSWQIRYWGEKLQGFVTDAILVMNDYDEKLCRSRRIVRNTDRIFRIPGMGVDLHKYGAETNQELKHRVQAELGITAEQKIILCNARIIPEKGVFILLEAARHICQERNDVCFLLSGTGPSFDELKRLIAQYKLESQFKLLGWRNDVSALMKASDIFVLPTYFMEGLPVAILEAMACSKPIIATHHRGCEDALADGESGFLIPIKQVAPLVDKIRLLLDHEELRTRMGKAARQRAEQCFELNYCTQKIIEDLEKAVL